MKIMGWLVFLMAGSSPVIAQKLAAFNIELPVQSHGLDIPVSIELKKFSSLPAGAVVLHEIDGKQSHEVPIQSDDDGTITWMIRAASKKNYRYELHKGKAISSAGILLKKENGSLTAVAGALPLLRYQFETVYPPAGIDSNYKRSGFIHPLWTPNGQVLTRIQPPDHYHHYGIWNPWTHTLFRNDTVDFWNIKGGQGTVRFSKFTSVIEGPVFAEFEALHEHVVFKGQHANTKNETIALNEWQKIRVYKPLEKADHYIIDFTSTLRCATDNPLLILAYRYGGLGWRATEEWDTSNCDVLTSEGKTRKDTDGSKAKWIRVQGSLAGDYGGAVLMSYPENYNHPEPLRIWDPNANGGRGDMFTNFAPTKDKDWLLEPGKTYILKYRFIVFNGTFEGEKAESGWEYFARPVKVTRFHAKGQRN
jgi:hypothetical protein